MQRWPGFYPTQRRVSTGMEVSTRLRYRVKKLWIARICVANCCGSYIAGFSTDCESVSTAFLMAGSVIQRLAILLRHWDKRLDEP